MRRVEPDKPLDDGVWFLWGIYMTVLGGLLGAVLAGWRP